MLVAQAPGKEENEKGEMFIGPSGKILDELLKKAKIKRNGIWMTNLVKCMLPDCRKPKPEEINSCSQYLDQEIELVNPRIIAPLGWYATLYILKKYNLSIPNQKPAVFGKLLVAGDKKIYPLSHPASILYNESYREKMERDYKKLRHIVSLYKSS